MLLLCAVRRSRGLWEPVIAGHGKECMYLVRHIQEFSISRPWLLHRSYHKCMINMWRLPTVLTDCEKHHVHAHGTGSQNAAPLNSKESNSEESAGSSKEEEPLFATPPTLLPPTNCCMSGCPNCVWIAYTEELLKYYQDGGEQALAAVEKHIQDENIKMLLKMEIKFRMKKN
ncbi:oxidoreductase-like domain-containing protein 1 [Sphaerodactylus townsendi]|uniref:oxidoreductase-like domain-containing protein 1 n=1 Tax=Sphaerodactylus townsendi TaxID=933632 RepID=UPI00202642E4|nr:oxidoreductase-like domain-containing protein 1 [Sphaerodactylus townsendi]